MPAKDTLAAVLKQGMLAMGQYRRTLARTSFPGVAVLGYHGLRADDLPKGSMAFENLHVRASTFEAHCRVVRECCDPITLDEVLESPVVAYPSSSGIITSIKTMSMPGVARSISMPERPSGACRTVMP